MKSLIVPATAALAAAAPGAAVAKPPTAAHAHAYERAYRQVARVFGRRAPGRNIIKDGFAARRAATDSETLASLGVLKRTVAPAPATGTAGTSTGTLPACASESGTAAGQDACAQTIYEHQGPGAWVGCGG